MSTTAAMPADTSACRTTATGWRIATSRSARCRDRAASAVGDDVPPVLRLGLVVRDDGNVPHPDAALHRAAGGVGVRRDRDRRARLAVLSRRGGGPLLRHGKAA